MAVIYLLGTGGRGGGGMGTVEGRDKGKHDLAPMVSTGAHAKGNPPTTTKPAQIHMGRAGGCVGNKNQGVKRMIIPVPSR